MNDEERKRLAEDIKQVKAWAKDLDKAAEKLEEEPALPSVEKEWADRNFWSFVKIKEMGEPLLIMSRSLAGVMFALNPEGRQEKEEGTALCPKCGEGDTGYLHFGNGEVSVLCKKCGFVGPMGHGGQEAVKKWNEIRREGK